MLLAAPGMGDAGVLAPAAVFGAVALPLYPLASASVNAALPASQLLPANALILLMNGLGGVLGPALVAVLGGIGGPGGLFWVIGVCCLAACLPVLGSKQP